MSSGTFTTSRGLAVVSGASSGIGKATALLLVAQGWEVVALGRRAEAPPEFVDLPTLRYGAADLTQEDPLAVLQRVAPHALNDVQVLVNSAGHDLGGGLPFDRHEPADWLSMLRLNVEATMRLTQVCLPAMLARRSGDIVVIGSITARQATPGLTAYSTSKHAMRGFVSGLRADYRDVGLRITEIAPGVVKTGFASTRLHGDAAKASEFYDGFAECLLPEDVARAVSFVLSQPPHLSVSEIVLTPARQHP
ncbi:MAG: short-chain dehydrogenase [Rhizobacter sp.]|nr:short-chain dehydrogenase [Rhizobacter sp.]